MNIQNKEIAKITKKLPSAITYMKQNKKDLYEVVKIGSLIIKEGLNFEDIVKLIEMYKQINKSS